MTFAPRRLPVQAPTKFRFSVGMKTAQELGRDREARFGSNSALGALLPHVRLAAVRRTLKAL
jgi:hypothetical protein